MVGFFAHHGVWAPGVRLFRNLAFRAKAMLISALFLVPIAVLGSVYLCQTAAALEHARNKKIGLSYGRLLVDLVQVLQRQRTLAARGEIPRRPGADTTAPDPAIAVPLARLAELQSSHGAQLKTSEPFEVLTRNIEKAVQNAGASPLAGYRRHSQAIEAAFLLLDAVIGNSGLAVDADLTTKYLIEAEMVQLPRIRDSALAMADLAAAIAHGAPHAMSNEYMVAQRAIGLYLDTQITQALDRLAASRPDVAQRLSYAATQEAVASLHSLAQSPVSEGGTSSFAEIDAVQQSVRERSQQLQKALSTDLDALLLERAIDITTQRTQMLTVLGVSLALAIYLFVSFARVMQGGLGEVRRHLTAMSRGDLTTSPAPWGTDEAADLMLQLRAMQDSLRQMVLRVRCASDEIVHSSREIASGSSNLSARTEQSATSLRQSAASLDQLSLAVKTGCDHAAEAGQVAKRTAGLAGEGGRVMREVVNTMNGIRSSSAQVSDIVATIDSISLQTSILALNAAVQAAQAGQQGRGFAIVASEVRALAQRSAVAARGIRDMICSSVDEVAVGVRTVHQAGVAVEGIVAASGRSSEFLGKVADATHQQTLDIAQISAAIQNLDRMTQQNATLAEETATASSAMMAQAQTLASEVARFRLPQHVGLPEVVSDGACNRAHP